MSDRSETVYRVFAHWPPLAAVATGISGLVYVAVQQDFRQSANDPQIQMAEDAAALLASGQPPQSVVPATNVDIAKSLAPFTMVFDDSGRTIASSAQLDGDIPLLPPGVFTPARARGEIRFTWQPAPEARSAVVIVHYAGEHPGFVLAGRSLREVEKRQRALMAEVGVAWVATLWLALAGALFTSGQISLEMLRSWLSSARSLFGKQ